MSTATQPLTHCPTCGVKLHRTDLSLCAYCAAPLRMGAAAAPPDDETAKLLKKIESHPLYPAALTWSPIDPLVERKAARLHAWGMFTLIVLTFSVVVAAQFFEGPFLGRPPVLGSVVLSAIAIFLFAGAVTIRGNAKHQPMLRRAARVLDRKSRTEYSDKVGATTYYFQLRFPDGSEGEFKLTGRGVMYEPPTVGASGVAYTRGDTLLEFKRL